MKKELLKAIQDDDLFDFICNNYHRMSKTELCCIIKELAYSIHCIKKLDFADDLKNAILENIEENFSDDEEGCADGSPALCITEGSKK